MSRIEAQVRDLTRPPALTIHCSNPICEAKVVYVGQCCAVCERQQQKMRETLRAQRQEAK